TEAVDVVHLAHPVVAALAVAALPARHDLLGDGAVADPEAVLRRRPVPQRDHLADEFVPRDDRRLAVALAVLVAPEKRRAEIAFEGAGADADRAALDAALARPGRGHLPSLEAIIFRTMADARLHGPRQGWSVHAADNSRLAAGRVNCRENFGPEEPAGNR